MNQTATIFALYFVFFLTFLGSFTTFLFGIVNIGGCTSTNVVPQRYACSYSEKMWTCTAHLASSYGYACTITGASNNTREYALDDIYTHAVPNASVNVCKTYEKPCTMKTFATRTDIILVVVGSVALMLHIIGCATAICKHNPSKNARYRLETINS